MPAATVIPELPYPDVQEAVAWLCAAFGLRVRLKIASHRAQLHVGDGAVVVREGATAACQCSVMVRVDDVDAHHQRTTAAGARILQPPTTYPYGERQYTALDCGGHAWTFSQSMADVDPLTWGGEPGEL